MEEDQVLVDILSTSLYLYDDQECMYVWDGEYGEEIDAERWTKAFTRRSHSMVDGWRSGSHSSRSVIIILAGRSCAGCKFVMYVMTG